MLGLLCFLRLLALFARSLLCLRLPFRFRLRLRSVFSIGDRRSLLRLPPLDVCRTPCDHGMAERDGPGRRACSSRAGPSRFTAVI